MEKPIHYYKYSDYLKRRYGEKVYKLPVNIPVTCPNRIDGTGCSFCSESGTGFEALQSDISVKEQLIKTQKRIEHKYHAHKFIAYFQNYTNTFLPADRFEAYLMEAANVRNIVEIAVSTRPDCISSTYLDILQRVKEEYHINITIELGLQTANYHTLLKINRGHTLAEFIDAVLMIHQYGYDICTHVILNLPWDEQRDAIETAKIVSALKVTTVKVHSLYIAKNTQLCHAYENGTITICSKEEYFRRVIMFLEHLSPDIAVERLFSRIPEEESVFCNWGNSWRKLHNELLSLMDTGGHYQGRTFNYLNGAALDKLRL